MTRRSDSADERTNVTRVTRVDRIHANPSGSRAIADGRERSRRWPTELKISHPMIHSVAVCQDAQPESASPRRSRVCREVARDGLDLETLRTVPSRRLAARSLVADRSRRGSASSARTVQKVKSAKARATKATNESSCMSACSLTCFRADRICHYKVHLSRNRLSVSLFNGCHFAGVPRENLSIMMAHLGTNSQCRSLFR